jgi:translocation protein SEC62
VECIIEGKKWPKYLPSIKDEDVAVAVADLLCAHQFFHRSEKVEVKKGVFLVRFFYVIMLSRLNCDLKYMQISKKNKFDTDGYYTWMYAGNMLWSNIATFAIVAAVIVFTLLPIWPTVAKKVLWYCSVTFLIFILGFCLIRFALFLVFWLFGYDCWIFPRLFDETLSIQDSFKPIISCEPGAKGQGYYRMAVLLGIGAFVYWATTQPTEFDEFLKAQSDFINDVYEGRLLADVSQEQKDNIMDLTRKRVPNVEDLLREIQEDERLEMGGRASARDGSESIGDSEASDATEGSTTGKEKSDIDKEYDDIVEGKDSTDNENEEEFSDSVLDEILNADFDSDMDA